ncbi:hypothetical protein Tco_0712365 [Tanacetum coccineum]
MKGWTDHFFWVDAFACPVSFSWHTSKNVSKDPFPKSSEFNAEHYAPLVAYPAPFHKYPDPFLCLVGISRYYSFDENTYLEFLRDDDEEIDLLSFIRTADPTKVKIAERQRAEDELKLLDTTLGRVVPLLPIAPARADSELEDSVDRLFNEGGSGSQTEQGDSAKGGDGAGEAAEISVEEAVPLQPRRERKQKTIVADSGEPSHPAKKLREDHRTPGGASVGGKSMPAIQRLLAGAVQNVVVRGAPVPSLPFVASLVSTTPDPVMASAVTGAKEAATKPSLFATGSSFASEIESIPGGFSDLTGNDFLVGGICTITDPDSDLQKVYVSRWNVTNGSRLDDNLVCHEMVDEFAPPRMCAEYNIKEKRKLKSVVDDESVLLKAKDQEIKDLKAQLLLKEAEAAKAIHLRTEASKFDAIEKSLKDEVRILREYNTTLEEEKSELGEKVADLATSVKVHELETSSAGLQEKVAAYENCMEQLEKFHDDRMKEINDKFDKLDADIVGLVLHLEVKFYPHLLTTISGRRWLLTHGVKLAIAKCLNSIEYLSVLGAEIGKAVEKGMQEGLFASITHGAKGRTLTDVAAYNPFVEADYLSALQLLQGVKFSLTEELKSNKDASVETIMNLLWLDNDLTEKLGLTESQPHINQLMVLIHHSPDRRIIGAFALSLSLDVSNFRVQKIRENLSNQRTALRDVFVPLSEPLSITALTCTDGTANVMSTTVGTTDALSVAPSSSIPHISMDDYEVAPSNGQESTGADVDPFSNVDDAELNIS